MLSLFTLQLSLLLDSSPSFSAQFTACYKILMVSYYNLVQHSVTQSSRLLEQALGTAGILTADYKNKKSITLTNKLWWIWELSHTLKLYCLEIATVLWAKLINHLHGFHRDGFFKQVCRAKTPGQGGLLFPNSRSSYVSIDINKGWGFHGNTATW